MEWVVGAGVAAVGAAEAAGASLDTRATKSAVGPVDPPPIDGRVPSAAPGDSGYSSTAAVAVADRIIISTSWCIYTVSQGVPGSAPRYGAENRDPKRRRRKKKSLLIPVFFVSSFEITWFFFYQPSANCEETQETSIRNQTTRSFVWQCNSRGQD